VCVRACARMYSFYVYASNSVLILELFNGTLPVAEVIVWDGGNKE